MFCGCIENILIRYPHDQLFKRSLLVKDGSDVLEDSFSRRLSPSPYQLLHVVQDGAVQLSWCHLDIYPAASPVSERLSIWELTSWGGGGGDNLSSSGVRSAEYPMQCGEGGTLR